MYRGRLTGDEGWYTLAALNVLKGKMPYKDFLFTQMPLMPYFYGYIMSFIGRSLVAARWISFFLGATTVVFVMATCYKRSGIWAVFLGGSLLVLNRSFIFDVCSVKTQSLTVSLTCASLFFAADDGKPFWRVLASILFMNLAFLTRLSMIAALVVLWAFVFVLNRKKLKVYLPLFILNIIILCFMFRYFYSDGNFIFGIYHFHSEYFGNTSSSLRSFIWFARGVISNQLPLLFCFLCALQIILFCLLKDPEKHIFSSEDLLYLSLLSTAYILTTALHASRPISYPIYQTSNIAFVAIFSALVLGRFVPTFFKSHRTGLCTAFLFLLLLAMPLQEYVAKWNGDGSPKRSLQAAKVIRSLADTSKTILTVHLDLVVESGLSLPQGYELGKFSYFPGMSDAEAAKLRIVNFSRLCKDISERKADVICVTEGDLGILGRERRQELKSLISDNYTYKCTISRYGQSFESLDILFTK